MYKTKIDLTEKTRRNVIVILNERLSEAIDLQSQVKQAHWNVKGPHFIALHEFRQIVGRFAECRCDGTVHLKIKIAQGVNQIKIDHVISWRRSSAVPRLAG